MAEQSDNAEYERLKNTKFKRQKLPGWRPVPTIASTTIVFICFGVIFIALEIVILLFSNKIIDVVKRYDDIDQCKDIGNGKCNVTLEITKDMEKTIMVYYQLNGFYQNHRRYVKSKSDDP